MAKIKITYDGQLINGCDIKFEAPCDCTAVTGIVVYYKNDEGVETTKDFSFRDAHKNDLANLGNLFAAGAYVKVILDTINGHAYLQNADTNAYLENALGERATKQYVDQKIAAIPTPDVSGQISTHNTSTTAHNDIRTLANDALPKSGGTMTGDLIPQTDGSVNLGSSDKKWNEVHSALFKGGLTAPYDTKIQCETGAGIRGTSYGHLILNAMEPAPQIMLRPKGTSTTAGGVKLTGGILSPEVENGVTLGSADCKWKDLYLGGHISDGTNSVAVANIATKSDVPTTPSQVGAAPAYSYGTEDLTAGSSPLETGKLYFVYE